MKSIIQNIENKYASNHQGDQNNIQDTNTDNQVSVSVDRHRKSPGNSVVDKPVVPRLNFVKAGISPKDNPLQ